MADIKLTQLPETISIETGNIAYIVKPSPSAQSYKGSLQTIGNSLINIYGLWTTPVQSYLFTEQTAEVILQGLNNATIAKLDQERVDLSNFFIDIDGGTFYDTYVGSSTFDGGPII